MVVYKVIRPGVSEWCSNLIQARLLLAEYIVAMKDAKATGYVELLGFNTPRKLQPCAEWVRFLNGSYPVKVRAKITVKHGVVVSRSIPEAYKPHKTLWDITTHPNPAIAAWLDCLQTDAGLRELAVRAPDARSLGIAMRVCKYTRSHNVQLTPKITRYLWQWVHDVAEEEE